MAMPHRQVLVEDNVYQRCDVLKRNRQKRQRYGEFFVEGVKCLNAALASGWDFVWIAHAGGRVLSDWAVRFIEEAQPEESIELAPELLTKLSEKEETSELVAVLRMPPDDLSRITLQEDSVVVVLDRPANPGNLGTSIRSCDAFGVAGVIVTGHAADIYHPQAVRGSMGALFSQNVVRLPSHNPGS